MAEKINFDLVSPERLLLSEAADMITVPGTEGEFGVLADHAPFMTALRPGMIRVENDGAEVHRIFVWGGFAEVTSEGLTILAEEAVPMDDIDVEELAQRVKDFEEDVADFDDPARREEAQDRLWHIREILNAAKS